jgi:CBS domain-containing protein
MGFFGRMLGFGAGYVVGAKNGMDPIRRAQDTLMRRAPRANGATGGMIDVRPIREVMTTMPRTVTLDTTLQEAARLMAEDDIGDVIVTDRDSDRVAGILTDRDIVIRAVAGGRSTKTTTVEEVFSRDLVAAAPEDTVHHVLELMRALNVRRLPVLEGDRAVGVVSLGDLSIQMDVGATLADISTAVPDR